MSSFVWDIPGSQTLDDQPHVPHGTHRQLFLRRRMGEPAFDLRPILIGTWNFLFAVFSRDTRLLRSIDDIRMPR